MISQTNEPPNFWPVLSQVLYAFWSTLTLCMSVLAIALALSHYEDLEGYLYYFGWAVLVYVYISYDRKTTS